MPVTWHHYVSRRHMIDHQRRPVPAIPARGEGSDLQPEAVLPQYGLLFEQQHAVPKAGPRVRKVDTDKGSWVLKRSRISEDEIAYVHAAQEHLAAQGFTALPRFKTTLDGQPCVRQQGQLLVLTPWIEAHPARLKRRRELAAAVRTIAEFHSTSVGFMPPDGKLAAERDLWGRWPELWRARLDQLGVFKRLAHESDVKTAFDRRYVGLVPYYWEQAATAIAMLLRTPYRRLMDIGSLERTLCHHDLAHHNILFAADGTVYLIDLDYCISDTRLHDLGSLIIRQCKRFGWELDWARLIIETYNRHVPTPLTQEELAVVTALVHWPQDFWQVGLQYYIERQPWPLQRFLSSLERKTSGRREREKFLASLKREYAPGLSI